MGGRHTHTAEETAPGGPTPTKCMIPSVGKSDRAAREDVVLHWVMDEEQAVAAVRSGAGSAGCQRLPWATARKSPRREAAEPTYDNMTRTTFKHYIEHRLMGLALRSELRPPYYYHYREAARSLGP